MLRRLAARVEASVFAEIRAGENSQTTAASAVWGQSSGPHLCVGTLRPRRPSSPAVRRPERLCANTRRSYSGKLCSCNLATTHASVTATAKVRRSLPAYFDSTSRRCGRRSRPRRRRCCSQPRVCRSRSGNARPLKREKVRGHADLSRRWRGWAAFLTAGFLGLVVTGHRRNLAVADPDAVVDLTLSQRILVTLATDADAAGGKLLGRLLQAPVGDEARRRRASAGKPARLVSDLWPCEVWAWLLTAGGRAPGTPRWRRPCPTSSSTPGSRRPPEHREGRA